MFLFTLVYFGSSQGIIAIILYSVPFRCIWKILFIRWSFLISKRIHQYIYLHTLCWFFSLYQFTAKNRTTQPPCILPYAYFSFLKIIVSLLPSAFLRTVPPPSSLVCSPFLLCWQHTQKAVRQEFPCFTFSRNLSHLHLHPRFLPSLLLSICLLGTWSG